MKNHQTVLYLGNYINSHEKPSVDPTECFSILRGSTRITHFLTAVPPRFSSNTGTIKHLNSFNPIYNTHMTRVFNLRNKVSEALKVSKLMAHNTLSNDFFVMIKIKVDGEATLTSLKKFKGFLEKERLRYVSSFSSRMGIMNISVYSY